MEEERIKIKGYEKFNNIQNKILIGVIGILAVLVLFPPWEATAPNGMTGAIGHHIVFFAPADFRYPSLDLSRLVLEAVGVLLLGGAAIYFVRD